MKTTNNKFQPATAMKTEKNLKMFASKMIRAIGLGSALMCAGLLSVHAADSALLKKLRGHVPAVVSQLKAKGVLPSNQTLDLAIGLPLHNCEELTNLLNQIYDPSSPNYHHYLTPEQFTEKFGPTKEDYQMVVNFARVNGFNIKATHSNRMLLNVSGKAALVEKAFHVKLHTYKHPTENRDFFAPDAEPSVAAILPIQDVSGLENFRMPRPLYKVKKGAVVSAHGAVPHAGSGPFGNYIGNDFRTAYVPGTTLNGSGQTVALVQFDGYLASDISAYESLAGRTNIPLQNVLLDGFSGAPTGSGGEVEVSLDIEMAVSMAPALAKIIVYEGDPFNFHPNDVLNQIAIDNSAKQISCSWGWTGGPQATTDQIFQQMALQGQSFFTASGDSDAYPTGTVDSPFNFGTPSDSAYLTSVGGTTLTMAGTGNSYASETVWNWGVRFGPGADGIGSSGGISSYYSIPSWQTNINMTARGGSAITRNFPDVALTADDTLVIADGGTQYIGVGGTSVAAPLWAGFMALANQQATNNGHASIGFLNPAIYTIANSANYTNCFHDITTGNNEWSSSPNLFVATNNYDLCTGLGTPNGTNLINALTSGAFTNTITHLSPPPPPYGSTLSALNGGNPNGTWELFVLDDQPATSGVISNGWILTLVTANPVGFSGDLSLGMTVSATNIAIGNTVIYTLTVTNYGPSVSSNVLVSDTLPPSTVLVTTNVGLGTVTRSGDVVTWNIGTLNTNSGSQLQLTAQLNNSGNLLNYATVNAVTPDANVSDDFASVTVTVVIPTPPVISSIFSNTNGTFQLTVTSPPVPTIIQASTNIVDWLSIYTNTPPFTFTDPDATNYPTRFYRALVP